MGTVHGGTKANSIILSFAYVFVRKRVRMTGGYYRWYMRIALDTIGLYNRMLIRYQVTKASRYPRHSVQCDTLRSKVCPKRPEKWRQQHVFEACPWIIISFDLAAIPLCFVCCFVHNELFVELQFLTVDVGGGSIFHPAFPSSFRFLLIFICFAFPKSSSHNLIDNRWCEWQRDAWMA